MYFFFVFKFRWGTFLGLWANWHSKLSLYAVDKQTFHLKIAFIVYRRASPYKAA